MQPSQKSFLKTALRLLSIYHQTYGQGNSAITAVRAYTKDHAKTHQSHSRTIGDALGFRGLMRAAKEKRKGYLLLRCSV